MIDAGWFVDVALKSVAVAGLALLAARMLRRRSAAERSSVLHGGLVALAALPLLMLFAPRWQVTLPAVPADAPALTAQVAAERAAAAPVADARHAAAADPARAASALRAPVPHGAIAAPATRHADVAVAFVALYALPALALLVGLGLSLSNLRTLRDRATPLRDTRWNAALRAAQQRCGMRGDVELLHSPDVDSPLSFGLRRRIVVLDADTIDPAEADAVLAHELAHLARHDWIKLLFAHIVTALFWFNPLAWMLARRCHQLREEAADDAVLRGDVAGVDYAELLLRFARTRSAQPALAAHAIGSGGGAMRHLSQRLARVLDDGSRRAPAMRAWTVGCTAAALTVAVPLAALTPTFAPAHAATPKTGVLAATRPEATIAVATADAPLTFTIGPRRKHEAGMVQLTFEQESEHGHSTNSSGIALASLQGLSAAALGSGQPQAVDFRLVRDAGTLHCEGAARHGRATGACRFQPDAGFARELERRGVGRIAAHDQLELALQDARLDVLDELQRQGYAMPNVERFIEFAIHGVDAAWLRGLQAAGTKVDTLQRLVELRIHDVDGDYIRDLKAAGYADLPPQRLIEFRIHDVTAESVLGLAEAGFAGMPPDQLVAMHIHDATPAFASEMKSLGYGDVGAERLIEFRIHGVSPDYVRELAKLGYRDLPARRLVEFRIHGVTPDFVREIDALGYRGVDPRDLVAMQIHNVTPGYIRRQQAKAGGAPTVEELVERRIHGD